MPNEDEVRDELVGLLRYANFSAIGRELGVSAQSVKNWSQGKHPSEDRLNAIKRLYGLPVASQGTTKEPPEPTWLKGLATKADIQLMVAEVVIPTAARQTLVALREAGLLPPDVPVHGTED